MKLRYKILSGILIFLGVSITALALVLSHNSPCEPAPAVSEETEQMKAIMYRCYGSPDVLELENVEKPTPDDDELLVRVRAASVNPYDWHYLRGSPYMMRLMSGIGAPKTNSLGVDFAGTVEAIGSNVTKFKPGDAVFGGASGAFAEYVTVHESRAVTLKPANVAFEHAASVGIAAVTALQAVRDSGKIQPGQKVLINGASGGVGTFAVQIAKTFGAEVTGVCSTRNVDMVRSIGADHVFDYKKEDYTESGNKYDVIIDMVGNHSLMRNRRVLTDDGNLVIVGGSKGNWLGPLMRPISAFLLSPFVDQQMGMMLATLGQDDLATLAHLMQTGKVTAVIDRRYSLRDVPAAIRYSEEGRARGKIIIEVE